MTLEKRPGDHSFWWAEDVCQMSDDGPFHSEISQTRPASDGVVFTAKRTKLVFTLFIWNFKSFWRVEWYRLSVHGKQRIWLVRNMLLLWQFHNISRKECCSHESTVILHQNKNVIFLFFVGIAVSGLMLRLKAKELSNDPSFKTSSGWYEKWKRRHLVSMRTKTTLAQQLPADLKENILWFHCLVIAARKRGNYPLSRIYNMDETPMRFELPLNQTLEFSGSRRVPVKSCRAEKQSFTVVLAVAADGAKVPPESHLQRRPYTERSGCATASSCFLP